MTATLTLTQIAAEINDYLKRFEADPKINVRDPKYQVQPYYYAHAWRAGSRVGVIYVAYQHASKLTRDDALTYLEWLRAGNVGTHYAAGVSG